LDYLELGMAIKALEFRENSGHIGMKNARQNAGNWRDCGNPSESWDSGKCTDVPNKKLVPNYEDSACHGDRVARPGVSLGSSAFRLRPVRFVARLCP